MRAEACPLLEKIPLAILAGSVETPPNCLEFAVQGVGFRHQGKQSQHPDPLYPHVQATFNLHIHICICRAWLRV